MAIFWYLFQLKNKRRLDFTEEAAGFLNPNKHARPEPNSELDSTKPHVMFTIHVSDPIWFLIGTGFRKKLKKTQLNCKHTSYIENTKKYLDRNHGLTFFYTHAHVGASLTYA